MTSNILITGATGFIGSHILLAALASGHRVRYTARSEDKAKRTSSNPAVQALAGGRLSSVIIPDLSADGAFDDALQGITHVIHVASPVPWPNLDPLKDIFEPMLKINSELLASALKTPSVQRIVITSSVSGVLGLKPPTTRTTASARALLPSPLPTFESPAEGYTAGKVAALHEADEFMRVRRPHFTLAHVTPGFVFGRNRIGPEVETSNRYLLAGLRGGEPPYPLFDACVHIDDLADLHLRAVLLPPPGSAAAADEAALPADFGAAIKVDYDQTFGYVEEAFPKAVAAGVFKKGTITTFPIDWDSSESEKLLGRKFQDYKTMVLDVAGQYLEAFGVEKS